MARVKLTAGHGSLLLLICGLLWLPGCASKRSGPPTVIVLRETEAEIENARETSLPQTERPQAHLSIRIWRLKESDRVKWLPALKQDLLSVPAAAVLGRNGIALARVEDKLVRPVRAAKTAPGWETEAILRVGRRVDIVIGQEKDLSEVTIFDPRSQAKAAATGRTLAMAFSLRSLDPQKARFSICPVLRDRSGRKSLDSLGGDIEMSRGQEFVFMRHPASGQDLGHFFMFSEMSEEKIKGPDGKPAVRKEVQARERCVIVSLQDLTGLEAPALEGHSGNPMPPVEKPEK